MPRIALSQKFVNDLIGAQPPERDAIYWDTAVRGFGAAHRLSGGVHYVVQWREPATGAEPGKSHRRTLGRAGPMLDLKAARAKALDQLRAATDRDAPVNPLATRKAAKAATLAAPTFRAFVEGTYLKSARWRALAASTRAGDLIRLHTFVLPAIGDVKLRDLTPRMIRDLDRDLASTDRDALGRTWADRLAHSVGRTKKMRRGGPGGARRIMRVVKSVLAYAVTEEALATDPSARLRIKADGKREVVPSPAEYARLWTALDTLRQRGGMQAVACDVIALIAMTGARRGEIAWLRWRQLAPDLSAIILAPGEHKGGHRTGKGKIIGLPDDARPILDRYQRPADQDALVFAGQRPGRPVDLGWPWKRVRKAAELPDALVPHALRHGAGTLLALSGATAPQIASQLGHSSLSSTAGYIHLAEKMRAELAQRTADLVRPNKLRVVGGSKA